MRSNVVDFCCAVRRFLSRTWSSSSLKSQLELLFFYFFVHLVSCDRYGAKQGQMDNELSKLCFQFSKELNVSVLKTWLDAFKKLLTRGSSKSFLEM